jgi:hypothetical protein
MGDENSSSISVTGAIFGFIWACFFCLFATATGRIFMPSGEIILLDLILLAFFAGVWAVIITLVIVGLIFARLAMED